MMKATVYWLDSNTVEALYKSHAWYEVVSDQHIVDASLEEFGQLMQTEPLMKAIVEGFHWN